MLILLVGPKGSGKSYIGRLLESALGVYFLHVERLWMTYHAECEAAGKPVDIREGLQRVRPDLRRALSVHEHTAVETTGASAEILEDLLALGSEFGLLTILVQARLRDCLARIAARDQRRQIPVDVEMIEHIHEISTNLEMSFDIVLKNTELTDEKILEIVSSSILVV